MQGRQFWSFLQEEGESTFFLCWPPEKDLDPLTRSFDELINLLSIYHACPETEFNCSSLIFQITSVEFEKTCLTSAYSQTVNNYSYFH